MSHAYLEEARLRYHSCMCTCCHDVPIVPSGGLSSPGGVSDNGSLSSAPATPTSSISSASATSSPADTPGKGSQQQRSANGVLTRRKFCRDLDPAANFLLPLDLDSHFKRLSDAKRKFCLFHLSWILNKCLNIYKICYRSHRRSPGSTVTAERRYRKLLSRLSHPSYIIQLLGRFGTYFLLRA